MISAFRRSLDTWPVRAFFLIMVAAFIIWGIGDVFRIVGTSTWVAKVGDRTVEGPVFQAEYQRGLNQATRDLPLKMQRRCTPRVTRYVEPVTIASAETIRKDQTAGRERDGYG